MKRFIDVLGSSATRIRLVNDGDHVPFSHDGLANINLKCSNLMNLVLIGFDMENTNWQINNLAWNSLEELHVEQCLNAHKLMDIDFRELKNLKKLCFLDPSRSYRDWSNGCWRIKRENTHHIHLPDLTSCSYLQQVEVKVRDFLIFRGIITLPIRLKKLDLSCNSISIDKSFIDSDGAVCPSHYGLRDSALFWEEEFKQHMPDCKIKVRIFRSKMCSSDGGDTTFSEDELSTE